MSQIGNIDWYQTLHIFYVINIQKETIEKIKIHDLINESLKIIKEKENEDLKIKLAILQMTNNLEWIKSKSKNIKGLSYSNNSNMTLMLEELNQKLKSNRFLKTKMGINFPVIIFITDSYTKEDYINTLNNLRNNYWYKNAYKLCFTLNNLNLEKLVDIVGSNKVTIKINDVTTLNKINSFTINEFTNKDSKSGLQIINNAKKLKIINEFNLVTEKGTMPEEDTMNLNSYDDLPF